MILEEKKKGNTQDEVHKNYVALNDYYNSTIG
jgi:hypothetical protein